MEKVKCISCEEIFDLENDYMITVERGDDQGKYVCESCAWDGDPIATLVYFNEGEKCEARVYYYTTDYGDDYGVPSYVEDYAESIKWHSTDAWRGYYDGKTPEGFELVKDSWFSGFDGHNMDDFMWKVEEKLKNNEIPPCDVLIAFTRTSNVFSTGFDLYVRSGDKETFTEWLTK